MLPFSANGYPYNIARTEASMYLPLPDILRRGRTFAKSPQDMGKNMKEQIRQEIMESAQCRDLYTELTEYERRGIRIKMNGDPASPLQIASAYAVREEPSYMRDYIADDEGMVKEVCFVELEDDDVRR